MLVVLHPDKGVALLGDIALIAYLAHEVGEPAPHPVAVELAQQRGMVEAYVASPTLVDVPLHVLLRSLAPGIRRVVQLQHHLVLQQFSCGNLLCRVQDGQLHVQTFLLLLQPFESCRRESLVQTASLSQDKYLAR